MAAYWRGIFLIALTRYLFVAAGYRRLSCWHSVCSCAIRTMVGCPEAGSPLVNPCSLYRYSCHISLPGYIMPEDTLNRASKPTVDVHGCPNFLKKCNFPLLSLSPRGHGTLPLQKYPSVSPRSDTLALIFWRCFPVCSVRPLHGLTLHFPCVFHSPVHVFHECLAR